MRQTTNKEFNLIDQTDQILATWTAINENFSKLDIGLVGLGASLEVTINSSTYVMTMKLKNSDGTVLSTQSIDLPLETMVVGGSYANGIVTLTLKNGQTVQIPIGDLISGLVADTRQIAGIDLQDDITVEELLTALSVYTKAQVDEKVDASNERITELERVRTMAESNFDAANKVVTGSDQINNALYWNAKRVNSFGGGEVTQDTTTGAQLFDKDNQTVANRSGVNLSTIDTGIKVSVQNASGGSLYVAYKLIDITEHAGENIVVYSDITRSRDVLRPYVKIGTCTSSGGNRIVISNSGTISSSNVALTAQLPSEITDDNRYLCLWLYIKDGGNIALESTDYVDFNNLIVKFGSTATAEDYEKYTDGTASPSPDYEQPVKMLTGNVQTNSDNVNLYNVFDRNTSTYASVDKDGWITMECDNTSGTSKVYPKYFTNNLNMKESAEYSLIAEVKEFTGNFTIQYYTSYTTSQVTDTASKVSTNLSIGKEKFVIHTKESFDNSSEGLRTVMVVNPGNSAKIVFRLSVLKDTTITTENFNYVVHEGQTFPLTLPEGMYLGDLGTASNFIFKNEKNSPYYNSSLVENANYWHKGWEKTTIDNETSGITISNTKENSTYFEWSSNKKWKAIRADYAANVKCNRLEAKAASIMYSQDDEGITFSNPTNGRGAIRFNLLNTRASTIEQLATWLETHNLIIAGELATEENIVITDTTLNTQLDTMWKQMKTYGITNFVITGGDIAGKLDLDYYVDDRVDLESRITAVEQALVAQNSD